LFSGSCEKSDPLMTQSQKVFCHLPALPKVIHRYCSEVLLLLSICTDGAENTGNSQLFDFFSGMGKVSAQKDHASGLFLFCHIQGYIQFIILLLHMLKDTAV